MAHFNIEALKEGKTLQREIWNKKCIRLCTAKELRHIIINGDDNKQFIGICVDAVMLLWTPHVDDLLADDWIIKDICNEWKVRQI